MADSGYGDPERIIILATEKSILILKENKIWYGDGTFSISPELFYQVYTLNVIFRGKNLPLVFVLLPNKKEDTYDKMFKLLLKDFNEDEKPLKYYHYYEKATLNSVLKNLPSIKIEGCYFHLVQSLWRQMQLKSLSKPYISDKTIRLNFNQLKCLAFVPSSEVIKCFKLIVSNSAEDFFKLFS